MKNTSLILAYFSLYFVGIWVLTTYEGMKIATSLIIAMLLAVSLLMTYYHRKEVRILVRKAEFYFLWKIVLALAKRAVKKQPLNYPFFVMMSFSRDTVLKYYLADYTMKEALEKFGAEELKKQKRRRDKTRRRTERIKAMTDEEFEEFNYRVERWKLHLSYNESRDVYKKAGIDI